MQKWYNEWEDYISNIHISLCALIVLAKQLIENESDDDILIKSLINSFWQKMYLEVHDDIEWQANIWIEDLQKLLGNK